VTTIIKKLDLLLLLFPPCHVLAFLLLLYPTSHHSHDQAANLAIVSAGMSLINVGSMNVVTLTTPMKSIGVSLGMNMLIRIIGSSIGPAMAGMYMQTFQSNINTHGFIQHFPSSISFDLIFISLAVLSIASLVLALLLRNRISKMRIPNLQSVR
jgi:hypothetical protein